jgi:hypothetical protein
VKTLTREKYWEIGALLTRIQILLNATRIAAIRLITITFRNIQPEFLRTLCGGDVIGGIRAGDSPIVYRQQANRTTDAAR